MMYNTGSCLYNPIHIHICCTCTPLCSHPFRDYGIFSHLSFAHYSSFALEIRLLDSNCVFICIRSRQHFVSTQTYNDIYFPGHISTSQKYPCCSGFGLCFFSSSVVLTLVYFNDSYSLPYFSTSSCSVR